MRATTSWFSTRALPRVAVQRIMLWARTAHCSQAELAWKLPDGTVFESGAFFEVADGELDDGVLAVEPVDGDDVVVEVGEKRVVSPVGPQSLLGSAGEPGAAHDQSMRALSATGPGRVGGLRDLGFAVVGVRDALPRVCRGSPRSTLRCFATPVRTAIV